MLFIWSILPVFDAGATTTAVRAVIDFSDVLKFSPFQIKFYFTVNQSEIKLSPMLTQIF